MYVRTNKIDTCAHHIDIGNYLMTMTIIMMMMMMMMMMIVMLLIMVMMVMKKYHRTKQVLEHIDLNKTENNQHWPALCYC